VKKLFLIFLFVLMLQPLTACALFRASRPIVPLDKTPASAAQYHSEAERYVQEGRTYVNDAQLRISGNIARGRWEIEQIMRDIDAAKRDVNSVIDEYNMWALSVESEENFFVPLFQREFLNREETRRADRLDEILMEAVRSGSLDNWRSDVRMIEKHTEERGISNLTEHELAYFVYMLLWGNTVVDLCGQGEIFNRRY